MMVIKSILKYSFLLLLAALTLYSCKVEETQYDDPKMGAAINTLYLCEAYDEAYCAYIQFFDIDNQETQYISIDHRLSLLSKYNDRGRYNKELKRYISLNGDANLAIKWTDRDYLYHHLDEIVAHTYLVSDTQKTRTATFLNDLAVIDQLIRERSFHDSYPDDTVMSIDSAIISLAMRYLMDQKEITYADSHDLLLMMRHVGPQNLQILLADKKLKKYIDQGLYTHEDLFSALDYANSTFDYFPPSLPETMSLDDRIAMDSLRHTEGLLPILISPAMQENRSLYVDKSQNLSQKAIKRYTKEWLEENYDFSFEYLMTAMSEVSNSNNLQSSRDTTIAAYLNTEILDKDLPPSNIEHEVLLRELADGSKENDTLRTLLVMRHYLLSEGDFRNVNDGIDSSFLSKNRELIYSLLIEIEHSRRPFKYRMRNSAWSFNSALSSLDNGILSNELDTEHVGILKDYIVGKMNSETAF